MLQQRWVARRLRALSLAGCAVSVLLQRSAPSDGATQLQVEERGTGKVDAECQPQELGIRYEGRLPNIARLLGSTEWRDRYAVIRSIVEGGDANATPVLKCLLLDPYPNVRVEAARALGILGKPKDIVALKGVLGDENPAVRAVSAWALGRIGNGEAIPELEKLAKDAREDVREQAETALARLGVRRVVERVIRRLGDPNPRVRRDAAGFLAEARCLAAVPELVRMLADDAPTGETLKVTGANGSAIVEERVCDAVALALAEITGKDFGFRSSVDGVKRKEVLDKWKQWIDEHRQEVEDAAKNLR